MIRVLIIDDHPAVRAGLLGLIRGEPGMSATAVQRGGDAVDRAERDEVDVALVDFDLPDTDGLSLCRQLKSVASPPGAIMYSAFAESGLAVGARIAGADALLDKATPTEHLLDTIRAVAGGRNMLPPPEPELVEASLARVEQSDLPILGMALDGTPAAEIAGVLKLDTEAVERRLGALLAQLRVRVFPEPIGRGPSASTRAG